MIEYYASGPNRIFVTLVVVIEVNGLALSCLDHHVERIFVVNGSVPMFLIFPRFLWICQFDFLNIVFPADLYWCQSSQDIFGKILSEMAESLSYISCRGSSVCSLSAKHAIYCVYYACLSAVKLKSVILIAPYLERGDFRCATSTIFQSCLVGHHLPVFPYR